MSEHLELGTAVEGRLARLLFAAKDNPFAVFVLELDGGGETRVTGDFPGAAALTGLRVRCHGEWGEHPRFGPQFKAEHFERLELGCAGLVDFLADHCPDVGRARARAIVDLFGAGTLDKIRGNPSCLCEVPGITAGKALKISEALAGMYLADIEVELRQLGLTRWQAARVLHKFEFGAIDVVRTEPYRLLTIEGFGFLTVDKIALAAGFPPDAPERLQAAAIHALRQAALQGHTQQPDAALAAEIVDLTSCEPARAEEAIDEADIEQRFGACALPKYYRAEKTIAQKFTARGEVPALRVSPADLAGLSQEQVQGVKQAATVQVSLLTGFPGTGKTFTTRRILQVFAGAGLKVELAAPTGKAASRLGEVTGRRARTIHRLLEFNPRFGFQRNAENPLDADAVILDECSMIDAVLMSKLVDALPAGCRLVIVGDPEQLPSVGAGNVLADLIVSGRIPEVRLNRVFRVQGESTIAEQCQRIRRGQLPIPDDFFTFVAAPNADMILAELLDALDETRAAGAGEVQVLCPRRRKLAISANELNPRIQAHMNPRGAEIPGCRFREGDRVIQVKNDYNLGVFNGEVGEVVGEAQYVEKDKSRRGFRVRFPFLDAEIVYPANYKDIDWAYCLSVHKSQGSEYDVVILLMTKSAGALLLQRTLLYTAMSRAKRRCVIIGEWKAVRFAVGNVRALERKTLLREFLGVECEK